MNHYLVHDTPIGELILEANLNHLTKINFNRKRLNQIKSCSLKKNLILEKTVEQLDEYFFNNRKFFTINYLLNITWFFKNEEQGIVLEDDCLPIESFFWYCENLLNRYKNDESKLII